MARILKFSFSLLSVFLICLLSVTFAQDLNPSEPALVKLPDWLQTNWTIVALAVSEAMAFLPAKFAGIAKAVFSVIGAVFGKRFSKS